MSHGPVTGRIALGKCAAPGCGEIVYGDQGYVQINKASGPPLVFHEREAPPSVVSELPSTLAGQVAVRDPFATRQAQLRAEHAAQRVRTEAAYEDAEEMFRRLLGE